jgi:thioredoxin-related protein
MIPHGRFVLLLAALPVLVAGCGDRLYWRSDRQIAMAEARHEGIPILIMFSAAMCQRCWHMDKEVFTDERVKEELRTYKLIRLDIFANADLAKHYDFSGTPSFVVLTSTGRVLGTHAGALGPAELIRFIQRARMNL